MIFRIFLFFLTPKHVQINSKISNLAQDWSQLYIVPARQSYICQYGKMASWAEKALCLLVFPQTKSVFTVQRQFQQKDGKIPPSKRSFRAQDTDERGLYKKLIDKFPTLYGRRLKIGFMLLEKLRHAHWTC